MVKRLPWFPLLLAVAMVGGCATQAEVKKPAPAPHGDVSWHAVADPAAPRYQLASMQVASTPVTGPRNVTPSYPAALMALHLADVTVRTKLVIDATGHVTRALIAGADSADANTQAFNAAVRDAVMQWTFAPLHMSTWKDMPDGSSKRVDDKAMPFSQDYVFTFALRNGKPIVSSGAPMP